MIDGRGGLQDIRSRLDVVEHYVTSGTGPGPVEYPQMLPSKSWIITHSFARAPIVAVFDSSGQQVEPDIYADSPSVLRLEFSGVMGGVAILT